MKLTKRTIDSLKYRGGWDVRWDDDIPGFGVRLYGTGKKAFVLSYRHKARKRLMVLGRYGADMTLEQARDRARKQRVRVRDGFDPLEERRREAQGQTFGELMETYLDRHARTRKRTWRQDEIRLKHIPAAWKVRRADAITRPDVASLHSLIGKSAPYEANRLLALLHIIFRLGQNWGFIDGREQNPAAGVDKFPEKKRKRWIKPEELPALAQAIDNEPNIYIRAAVWLYIVTGMRKSELLSACWEDVDWQRGQLRLPETKAGEEQSVSLNSVALGILHAVPRQLGNPYILAGAKPRHHLVNIGKPWDRIRTAAGIKDVRLHDLRRTVGSWLTQEGIDLNLIKEALRHANITTTLIYARLGADPVREVMEEHGMRVLAAAGKKGPAETVKLSK